jgi:hypothetical protein
MSTTLSYTTVQGDYFDLISLKTYGSEIYANVLMRLNPAYSDVVQFDSGIVFTLPTISSRRSIANAPWSSIFVTP